MNKYLKVFSVIVISFFLSCKGNNESEDKKQISDFDAFLQDFQNADYVKTKTTYFINDTIQDYYVREIRNNKITISLYDGKTKNKVKLDAIKGKVTNEFFSTIEDEKKIRSVILTISQEDKELARILQYNPNTKKMEIIFEYPIITKIGNTIKEINSIDIFQISKENYEKIVIWEGKLIDKDYTNVANIKPKNKKVLKTFLYNREKMIFEEQKSSK